MKRSGGDVWLLAARAQLRRRRRRRVEQKAVSSSPSGTNPFSDRGREARRAARKQIPYARSRRQLSVTARPFYSRSAGPPWLRRPSSRKPTPNCTVGRRYLCWGPTGLVPARASPFSPVHYSKPSDDTDWPGKGGEWAALQLRLLGLLPV